MITHCFDIHSITVRVTGSDPVIMEQILQELKFFECTPIDSPRISVKLTQKKDLHADKTDLRSMHPNPNDEINWIVEHIASILNIPERSMEIYFTNSSPADAIAIILFGTLGFMVHQELILREKVAVFHGACLFKNQGAVLLLGKTNSGKTSLSYLMTGHGYTYLSEEDSFVRMDQENRYEILPYPRRIRIPPHVMDQHPDLQNMPFQKEFVQSLDEQIYRMDPRKPFPQIAPLKKIIYLDNNINNLEISTSSMKRSEALFALLSSMEVTKIRESPEITWNELKMNNRIAFQVADSIVDRVDIIKLKYNITKDFSDLPGFISKILKA